MDAQCAALALEQYGKIAPRLRRLYHPESELLPGYRQIDGVIARDLQKDAAVRTTFISLTGGMQKPRAKSQASRVLPRIPHTMANALQHHLMLAIHRHVGQQSEIVAGGQASEVHSQN